MNLFNKKPKDRVLYAVTAGDYIGKFIVFINKTDTHYEVMAIGGKDSFELLTIPIKDVEEGLKLGILDKVRKVPKDLYKLCCMEYNLRKKEPVKEVKTPYKEFYERYGNNESTN